MRYWKRSIEIAQELGVTVMNSELNGRPENASLSEARFWRSLEELLPVFERAGVKLALEPHPDDFIEDGIAAVNLIRGINSPNVSFLYCAPHTFHQGGNLAEILRAAGDRLTMVHLADGFDHRASSGLRYITNPPGNSVRVHQHLDMNTLYVERALIRNVSAGGRISGAGMAARWTTASAPESASAACP